MYSNRSVRGMNLRRILTQVINRLNEISDEDPLDSTHILDDSDYEPSEVDELQIVDMEDSQNFPNNFLTQKERDTLGYTIAKKVDDNLYECCICLDKISFRQHLRTLCCKHKFHKKCIDSWLQRDRRCPTCRTEAVLRRDFSQPISRITRSSSLLSYS